MLTNILTQRDGKSRSRLAAALEFGMCLEDDALADLSRIIASTIIVEADARESRVDTSRGGERWTVRLYSDADA